MIAKPMNSRITLYDDPGFNKIVIQHDFVVYHGISQMSFVCVQYTHSAKPLKLVTCDITW